MLAVCIGVVLYEMVYQEHFGRDQLKIHDKVQS